MSERDSYNRGFHLQWTRFATDNVTAQVKDGEYNGVIPPVLGFFLILDDNTNFLLLDGEDMTLL